eukprot:CCRYP_007716-RC/>CCRYP_007716-RC protein AED:0.49 eAED:1.00 QI:0/-1/0/1/-1/0/1/0/53
MFEPLKRSRPPMPTKSLPPSKSSSASNYMPRPYGSTKKHPTRARPSTERYSTS